MKIQPKKIKAVKEEYAKKIDSFYEEAPKRIRVLRKTFKGEDSVGLTQSEAAECMDMIYQNYNKLEFGKNSKWGTGITIEHLIKLCTIHGCSADFIVFGKTEEEPAKIKELEKALESERRLVQMLTDKKKR